MALLGGDHARLAGERAERLRAGVVAAVDDDPAQVEPPQLAEHGRQEILALEADEEQLSDLALDRQAADQVADRSGHPRVPGAGPVGGRRDDPREEGGVPLALALGPGFGQGGTLLLLAAAGQEHAAGGGHDRHGQKPDGGLNTVGR